MDDLNGENDRLVFDIEQFLLEQGAYDYVHYFLKFNYDKIRRREVTLILAPIDAALKRLVYKSGKSLDVISLLPEGKDILTNFVSSTLLADRYPVYVAINGTTFGQTRAGFIRLNPITYHVIKHVALITINAVITRNTQQMSALIQADIPPNNTIGRTNIIGGDSATQYNDLPNTIIRKIALELLPFDIVNYCRIDSRFNSVTCDSEDFWNEKMRKDHPGQRIMVGGNWKETYKHTRKLYTYGNGGSGQLGHGDIRSSRRPKLVEGLSSVTVVAAGASYTAVISNGQLYTFGLGLVGMLGHGNTEEQHKPKRVEGLDSVTFVAAGTYHTAAISNSRLYTFGNGQYYQLGHGDEQNRLLPKLVENLDNVTYVAAGFTHTAAISNYRLYTFGIGQHGKLGHGDVQNQIRPKLVEGLDRASFVACGPAHTAVISNGQLYTFGYGRDGMLGHGNEEDQFLPKLVEGLSNVTCVACGSNHTAAVSNGQLYTFGLGEFGRLGHGNEHYQYRPKRVEGLDNVTFVSVNRNFTAVISNSRLYTFGQGVGHTIRHKSLSPQLLESLSGVISVAVGGGGTHVAIIALYSSIENP